MVSEFVTTVMSRWSPSSRATLAVDTALTMLRGSCASSAAAKAPSNHPTQYAPGVTWNATRELIDDAVIRGSAVAAFNVITLDHAEAIVTGAAEAGTGVLLQLSQNALAYHGAPEPILAACREIAAAATVPVGIHLDHLEDADLVHRILQRSLELGVGSLMFDASRLDDDANVRATSAICRAGQASGLWVEAELGEVGGKDGAHAPGARTDPDEARAFVERTGVDGLAVAVGSSHAMRERTAAIDTELVLRLAGAVPVPLVLHGSSGVADAVIAQAVSAGIRKVNVGTALNLAGTEALRQVLAERPDAVDPRVYGAVVRRAMADTVAQLCRVISTPA
jgi:fructose-bisphosphate aldolase class II